VMVPAMNLSMLEHPAYLKYRKQLEEWGVNFLQLPCEEGRLKIPPFDVVVARVLELL
jgi:phosphopantothenoylcysteine synthetase/decarboxylase